MKAIRAYYGHHKCASMWISTIVRAVCGRLRVPWIEQDHALEFPDDDYPTLEASDYFLISLNSDYIYVRNLECLGFHVIRDPRDIIVSGYFSHMESHETNAWPQLRLYREYLRGLDKDTGLVAEIEFSSKFLYHIYSWDYDNPLIVEKTFEELVADPASEFRDIFRRLKVTSNFLSDADLNRIVSDSDLERIVDHYSFKNMSGGRLPGKEATGQHYRKGVPGDWKNHFSTSHKNLFKELYNPVLLKTRYETSADW